MHASTHVLLSLKLIMEALPNYEQNKKRKLSSFCPNSTFTRGMIPSEFEVMASNISSVAENSYFPK